ncbi:uncharacterized protein LOC134285568 [Aedes albopictus]|uniref:Secreted protein n=1 Tax=Aedes albopictus TaxID=7160 RepID=A0ABM1YZS9_AEDAL
MPYISQFFLWTSFLFFTDQLLQMRNSVVLLYFKIMAAANTTFSMEQYHKETPFYDEFTLAKHLICVYKIKEKEDAVFFIAMNRSVITTQTKILHPTGNCVKSFLDEIVSNDEDIIHDVDFLQRCNVSSKVHAPNKSTKIFVLALASQTKFKVFVSFKPIFGSYISNIVNKFSQRLLMENRLRCVNTEKNTIFCGTVKTKARLRIKEEVIKLTKSGLNGQWGVDSKKKLVVDNLEVIYYIQVKYVSCVNYCVGVKHFYFGLQILITWQRQWPEYSDLIEWFRLIRWYKLIIVAIGQHTVFWKLIVDALTNAYKSTNIFVVEINLNFDLKMCHDCVNVGHKVSLYIIFQEKIYVIEYAKYLKAVNMEHLPNVGLRNCRWLDTSRVLQIVESFRKIGLYFIGNSTWHYILFNGTETKHNIAMTHQLMSNSFARNLLLYLADSHFSVAAVLINNLLLKCTAIITLAKESSTAANTLTSTQLALIIFANSASRFIMGAYTKLKSQIVCFSFNLEGGACKCEHILLDRDLSYTLKTMCFVYFTKRKTNRSGLFYGSETNSRKVIEGRSRFISQRGVWYQHNFYRYDRWFHPSMLFSYHILQIFTNTVGVMAPIWIQTITIGRRRPTGSNTEGGLLKSVLEVKNDYAALDKQATVEIGLEKAPKKDMHRKVLDPTSIRGELIGSNNPWKIR